MALKVKQQQKKKTTKYQPTELTVVGKYANEGDSATIIHLPCHYETALITRSHTGSAWTPASFAA